MKLDAIETDNEVPGPVYKDKNVSIYAIPVSPPNHDQPTIPSPKTESSPSLKRKHPDIHASAPSAKRMSLERTRSPQRSVSMMSEDPDAWRKLVVTRMFPGKDGVTFHSGVDFAVKDLRQRLPSWTKRPFATSYLAMGPEFRGKFDSVLADTLGVPSGPARRKLTLGENITLQNGQVITPDMVIGKSIPSAVRTYL